MDDEYDAEECIEYDEYECGGKVGPGHRGFLRCTHHNNLRLDRAENSMERYADCPLPPDWFDPSYAGERWDEED